MHCARRSFLRQVMTWGLVPAAAAALAQEKARPLESGAKVTVSFNVLQTAPMAGTFPTMTMQQDLVAGQTFVGDGLEGRPFAFGVGGVGGAGGAGGCNSQLSIEPPESKVAGYPLVWSADAKVLEASTDRIVLSASWRRLAAQRDGAPVESSSDAIDSISLRETDRVILDFARAPGCLRNAALELTARVKEDPAFERTQIAYDLWLVHEAAGGKPTSLRAQVTASQGEKVPFEFPRQWLPAAASGESGEQRLAVTITGQLRGRLRSGGTLELALDTARSLSYVASDGSSDGGIGESGVKVVAVRPGEAVRVELPDPARGVAARDPRAAPMSKDLAGHAFAVIVRAQPLS